MRIHRSSGVLLHVSSLPGGRLGREAFRFVDWLAAAGQSWWALLPLGPPDWAGSPYASSSAFAAHTGYLARPDARVSAAELEAFRARERYWLDDWAAFAGPGAELGQARFDREWSELRRYAAGRGIRLLGDVPIYVAPGADTHAHPELFQHGLVGGAPPDALSATGQLWGSPLYDWSAMKADGYRWWVERLRRTFELVDLARLDHFRGFVSYWAVPARNRTALRGRWRRGPGAALFRAAEAELGPLPLVAEDLGIITPPVEELRVELGFPGMVVMQFGYEGPRSNLHRLANHRPDSVVYVGTHDMNTALGWWRSLSPRRRAATGLPGVDPSWELIEAAFSSPAELAVVQAQDILSLGSEARMNMPGTSTGNWRWRLEPGQLTQRLADRLRAVTERSGRLPGRHPTLTEPLRGQPPH